MPKIGNYTPNNPLAPFIQSSPGPVSAPNLPNTGSALAEGNIRNAAQSAANVSETGDLVRGTLVKGLGAVAAGVAAATTLSKITAAKQALINKQQTNSIVNNAVQEMNDAQNQYQSYTPDQQSLDGTTTVRGYTPDTSEAGQEKQNERLKGIVEKHYQKADAIKDNGTSRTNYQDSMDNKLTEFKKQNSEFAQRIMESQAKDTYGRDAQTLEAKVTGSGGDLNVLTQQLDMLQSHPMVQNAIIGHISKEQQIATQKKLATFSLNAGKERVSDDQFYRGQSKGDYLQGYVAQSQAIDTYRKQIDDNPTIYNLAGDDKQNTLNDLEKAKTAAQTGMNEIFKNNMQRLTSMASEKSIDVLSGDIDTRNSAQKYIKTKRAEIQSLINNVPEPYRSSGYEAMKQLDGYLKGEVNVGIARAANEQSVKIQNIEAENTNLKQEANQIKQSDKASAAEKYLADKLAEAKVKLEAARASNKSSMQVFGYQKGTNITADDIKDLRQYLEDNWHQGHIGKDKYASTSAAITTLANSVLPINVKNPTPGENPIEAFYRQEAMTRPVDLEWAKKFVGDITSPRGKAEIKYINSKLPSIMQQIENAPENKGLHFSADNLRKMAEIKIMNQWITVPRQSYNPPQTQSIPTRETTNKLLKESGFSNLVGKTSTQ